MKNYIKYNYIMLTCCLYILADYKVSMSMDYPGKVLKTYRIVLLLLQVQYASSEGSDHNLK